MTREALQLSTRRSRARITERPSSHHSVNGGTVNGHLLTKDVFEADSNPSYA